MTPSDDETASAPTADRAPARVLVAEADEGLRTALGDRLRARGLACDETADGEAALDALLTGSYACAFVNVELPLVDGLTVTSAFRTSDHPAATEMPVFCMVPGTDAEFERQAIAAGVDAIVLGPVVPEVFDAYVTLVLNSHGLAPGYGSRLRRTAGRSELLNTLLDSIPISLFTKDAETRRYRTCNQVFADFACLPSPQDIVGRTDEEIFGIEEDKGFAKDDLKALASDGKIDFMETVTNPAGRVYNLHTVKTAFTAYDGRRCLLGLSVDRTEEARQLEIIRQERDRAVSAEKAKSYFFSTVSHDIRTPLNAIVGFAEMLKLGIDDPVERKHAIDAMLTSSQALQQLINDVLDLSKLEAGKMDILPEPTNCVALVSGVVDAFRALVGKKPVRLVADLHAMPSLVIDPQRLRQVLFNLIGNAVKFTDSGEVRVTGRYADGTLTLSVRDTGCGISEGDLKKIAEPYVQVGSRGRNGGTGLGLAIVRQLVARMKGTVGVASQPGVGTEFRVTIPGVAASAQGNDPRLSATQRIRCLVSDGTAKPLRVLVVDDSSVNIAVLRGMLKALGHTDVVSATNGREALELLESEAFEMVLTDVWMPEADGETLVKALRARGSRIPVYAVTADVEMQKDYARLGFTGLLLKPVTLARLKEVVGAAAPKPLPQG